jgi:probable rRNA maturation factor
MTSHTPPTPPTHPPTPQPPETGVNPRLAVEVFDATRQLEPKTLSWLTEHIHKAVLSLGGYGEVRVRIVGDDEMARQHEEFAGVPGTTDVLTFDLVDLDESPRPAPPAPEGIYTDIVRLLYVLDTDILVCRDVAERHVAAAGYPYERELLLYVVHGVLHCVGMDDHDPEESQRMHAMEDIILSAIGVGPVYRTGM